MTDARLDAMLQELGTQRMLLGDRCAMLAADNAELRAEVAALKKRIAELDGNATS